MVKVPKLLNKIMTSAINMHLFTTYSVIEISDICTYYDLFVLIMCQKCDF